MEFHSVVEVKEAERQSKLQRRGFAHFQLKRISLGLFLSLIACPTYAASRSSDEAIKFFGLNAPVQQSNCEIRTIKIWVEHPNLDLLEAINRYGIFSVGQAAPPLPPSTYRDPGSDITFYVESDGRHVAAIGAQGNLLWVRNPFVDNNMCPYRSAHPFIRSIGSVEDERHIPNLQSKIRDEIKREIQLGRKAPPLQNDDRFVWLTFNSSQNGYLNIRNGDYFFMGQN